MPKRSNQRLKIWYLYKILFENSDEDHPLTMKEILAALKNYGIDAERKSVYSDIELLTDAGVDIVSQRRRNGFVYYIGERDFQLAELKLLADCVTASKFITAKKSAELISKLEKLTSKNLAATLQRQVYITDRVKTFNERIYYSTDIIHSAVNSGNKISFKYYMYNTSKEKKFKNNGEPYVVSPYSLVCSDDNYYLLAYYPKYNGLTHFRVDKMTDIQILDEKKLPAEDVLGKRFNPDDYVKKVFNMFKGRTENVTLSCEKEILGAVLDKFGNDVFLRKQNEDLFYATVKADVSPTFYAWVFMFGGKIEIISPENVCEEYKEMLKRGLDASCKGNKNFKQTNRL